MSNQKYPELPILMVDDEEDVLLSYKKILRNNGINNLILCQDSREVLNILSAKKISLILLDLSMPHISGQELIEKIKEQFPHIPVIVITGSSKIEDAVDCMKLSAFDYLLKPIDKNRIYSSIKNAMELNELKKEVKILKKHVLSRELEHPEAFNEIITISDKMKSVFKYIEAVASSPKPILITGESGVGKELIAKVVHDLSGHTGSFVPVNIAGLDDTIFTDTLFGHKKGAFTGAQNERSGLIEKAEDGTLFLDEIGDLESSSQIKLFRLLQENEYYKMGSDIKRLSRARIVAATSVELEKKILEKTFRNELYFRLITHQVHIPPLRERLEDLPLLVSNFVDDASSSLNKGSLIIPDELINILLCYSFPGNIRELQAIIFNTVSITKTDTLDMSYIKEYISKRSDSVLEPSPDSGKDIKVVTSSGKLPTLKEMENFLFREAIKKTRGNQSAAAKTVGVSQPTFNRWVKENEGSF